ncbi:MAG: glutamate--cysteine ligase [Thermodesulfobacteriota bacterium]
MDIIKHFNLKAESKSAKLERWFEHHLNNILVPLYSSVDLRVSDRKIVPVDTNIFPAGFNNLSEEFWTDTGNLFKKLLITKYPNARKILIVPELHTKNKFYWENIRVIKTILENVDYEVKVGIVDEQFDISESEFITTNGDEITAYKVKSEDHRVKIEGFDPDIILLNNDFSEKCPNTLRDITQPVLPPVEMGWHTRRKDIHFEFYNSLAGEVAEILEIDPWEITIDTALVENVDFDEADDRKKVYEVAKTHIRSMKQDYEQRGVLNEPSLFIKSNSGTYGMAVLNITDVESIVLMNASNRKRLRVTKGGKPVRDVVVQESIPTILKTSDGYFAEPVIYMVDDEVAGGFFRVNTEKSQNDNLNSKGMQFQQFFNTVEGIDNIPLIFKLISKIAVIASGYEIEKIIREGGCKEAAN